MLDNDVLCRAALFPKFIQNGVFDEEALLQFTGNDDSSRYVMSVASRYILKNEGGVHPYGCKAAKASNDRFFDRNGRQPTPLSEMIHYLGSYNLTYGDVKSVAMTYYNVLVKWRPENDSQAHYQIEFEEKGDQGTKKERRSDRTAAIGVLATMLIGPDRHVCPIDHPINNQLSSIDLPILAGLSDQP